MILAVGGIQLLILLLSLARVKFLSVTLGPAGYGIVATIDQIVLALISLGALGLPFAALKFMAGSHSGGHQSFARTYASFFWALATLGVLTATVGVGLGILAPETFGRSLADYRWIIALAMVGIPGAMLNMLVANALAASQRGSLSATFTLAIQAVLLAATVIGVYAAGMAGIYIATAAGGFLTTLIAIVALRRTLGSPLSASPAALLAELKNEPTVITYSAWLYIASAVYAVSLSGLRTSVFSNLGASNAGMLQVALALALTMGAVVNPISNLVLTPFLNRSISQERKVDAANVFAGKVLILLLVVALPLVLFPRLVVGVLFAREFLPAAAILFAFIVWQVLAQLVNVYTQLLVGLDDVTYACVTISVSFGAVFLIAPRITSWFGLQGAAVALIGGSLLGGISSFFRLKQKFGVFPPHRMTVQLVSSIAAILIAAAIPAAWAETSVRGFALRGAIAIAVVVVQWRLLDDSQRLWVKSGFSSDGRTLTETKTPGHGAWFDP